jgi:chaperonin GroEL (HSP60 family)
MIRHLDKVTELQVFVREHPEDSQAIANLVRELFGTGLENTVTDGCGIDMNIRDIIHKLLDYAEPIQVMLNQMPILTGQDAEGHSVISEELETEIRNYIQFKQAGL